MPPDPKRAAEWSRLREDRQKLCDLHYQLQREHGKDNTARIASLERRMDAIDRKLNEITGTRNNWRKDISPNQ